MKKKSKYRKRLIKIRRSWKIHPGTRIEKSETTYDRKREKRMIAREIQSDD